MSSPLRTSGILLALAALPGDRVAVGSIVAALKDRAYALLVVLLGLPNCLPMPPPIPLVCGLVLAFVASWNNYFLPLVMLADERLYPITLGLDNWRAQTDRLPEFFQLTTGGALLSVIPLAILILVLQRFWRGGLTEGSVKG